MKQKSKIPGVSTFSYERIRKWRLHDNDLADPKIRKQICDNLEFARRVILQRKRDKRRRKSPAGKTVKYLTTEQFAFTVQYLERSESSRDKITLDALIILAETGIRVNSLINLRFEHSPLGHGQQSVWVFNDKGKVDHVVVISEYLKNYLFKMAEKRGVGKGYVLLNEADEKFGYQALYQRFTGLGRKVNLKWPTRTGKMTGLTPHVLRHTFSTHNNETHNDKIFTADQLGHREKSVTAGYIHVPEDSSKAKANAYHEWLWRHYKQGFLPLLNKILKKR